MEMAKRCDDHKQDETREIQLHEVCPSSLNYVIGELEQGVSKYKVAGKCKPESK